MTVARQSPWSVAIIVPARDEETTVAACVGSILAASVAANVYEPWIVVIADSCRDRTADAARSAVGSRGEVLECQTRAAGAARCLGVAAALKHFSTVAMNRLWIANTDADTMVTTQWIAVQLQLADQGFAGVAGIVHLDAESTVAAQESYGAFYLMNGDGTHDHVHGANIAMRADAYLDVGGWSQAALAEDHCLWERLRNGGWPLSSPVDSVVVTSGRLEGRAIGGFATKLQATIAARHVAA